VGWVVFFGIIVFCVFQQSETLRLAVFLLIVAGIVVAALIVFGVILVRLIGIEMIKYLIG